jgi:hypothetical protein
VAVIDTPHDVEPDGEATELDDGSEDLGEGVGQDDGDGEDEDEIERGKEDGLEGVEADLVVVMVGGPEEEEDAADEAEEVAEGAGDVFGELGGGFFVGEADGGLGGVEGSAALFTEFAARFGAAGGTVGHEKRIATKKDLRPKPEVFLSEELSWEGA